MEFFKQALFVFYCSLCFITFGDCRGYSKVNYKKVGVTMKRSAKLWSLSFILLTVANALLFLVFEMMFPTLPLFITTLGGSAAQVGLVTGVFMVSAIAIRPFSGFLATKIDKKYLLIIGVVISALSTGAYYLAPNMEVLMVTRLIHGIGFGLATTYFVTIVAEIIPVERRGEGIGYFGVGETVAISIGPMVGIMLLDVYGYQRLFLGGMAFLLLATLSIFLVKRKAEDVLPTQRIRFKLFEKQVLLPTLLALFVGVAAGGVMSYMSLYALEKNFEHVGLFFFIVAAAGFIVRFISGRLFDKYGPSIILIPAGISALVGLYVLYLAEANMSFFIAAVLYGLGFGAIFPTIQTWCLNLVKEHEHEGAMSSFFNMFDLGIGGGAVLLGLIATNYSYQTLYLVTIVFYVIFLLLYIVSELYKIMVRKRMNKNDGKQIDKVRSL